MAKILKDLVVTEISLVDEPANPGAQVLLFKNRKKEDYPTMTEAEITKALAESPLLKLQADAGHVRKVSAELHLDARAREIQKAKGGSFAAAYCAAMDENPALAELAVGTTTEVR